VSNIKITTNRNTNSANVTQSRGQILLEEKELITTPVSIEFNLENTVQEFNIVNGLRTLLEKLVTGDQAIRIYDPAGKKILWEPETELPESSKFEEDFQFREYTYRKGNKKAIVHCVIESQYTINKLKFMEPVRTHILENIIWVKPDFYSTKVVHSPGFITLVHPQITNKQEYK